MFLKSAWKKALDVGQKEVLGSSFHAKHSTLPSLNLSAALSSEKFFYTPSIYQSQSQPEISSLDNKPNTSSVTGSKPSSKIDLSSSSINFNGILGTKDLSFITQNINKLIDSKHPMLSTVSNYYFNAEGKKLRPLLVLLTSKMHASSSVSLSKHSEISTTNDILDKQKTLAFITEMIHTASLLHDDVIDDASMRRGQVSVNYKFGNKMSILAGDYLLSRASVALARLGSLPVVELLAEVIGELVEGEVMQMNGISSYDRNGNEVDEMDFDLELINQCLGSSRMEEWQRACFQSYIRKTYMKTASLMAKSCQASVLLRDPVDLNLARAAFDFGRNAGIAFQLIDDYLDFAMTSEQVGKPSGGSDLRLGLATAPVLFASLEYPSLQTLIQIPNSIPEHEREGFILRALEMIKESNSLEKTKELASRYSVAAISALSNFPQSPARDALETIANSIVTRIK